jgi:hypothetical protein
MHFQGLEVAIVTMWSGGGMGGGRMRVALLIELPAARQNLKWKAFPVTELLEHVCYDGALDEVCELIHTSTHTRGHSKKKQKKSHTHSHTHTRHESNQIVHTTPTLTHLHIYTERCAAITFMAPCHLSAALMPGFARVRSATGRRGLAAHVQSAGMRPNSQLGQEAHPHQGQGTRDLRGRE